MSDLVFSLRNYAKNIEDPTAEALMLRAADRIAQLEADLAHADAKGQENDKLLWGTIERVKKLEAALSEAERLKLMWRKWYDNEVGVSEGLRKQLAEARAALEERT